MKKKKGESLNEDAITRLEASIRANIRAKVKSWYLEELRLVDQVKDRERSPFKKGGQLHEPKT